MEHAVNSSTSRVIPFTAEHQIVNAFRRALQQHRKAPTCTGLSSFLRDVGVARIVCPDIEGLRDLQDSATWLLAVTTQEITATDEAVRSYEASIA
jgi:hypothetical protein